MSISHVWKHHIMSNKCMNLLQMVLALNQFGFSPTLIRLSVVTEQVVKYIWTPYAIHKMCADTCKFTLLILFLPTSLIMVRKVQPVYQDMAHYHLTGTNILHMVLSLTTLLFLHLQISHLTRVKEQPPPLLSHLVAKEILASILASNQFLLQLRPRLPQVTKE